MGSCRMGDATTPTPTEVAHETVRAYVASPTGYPGDHRDVPVWSTPDVPTPTVELAPVAETVVAAANYGYIPGNVEQWRGLVASIFPAEMVDQALRVMACESGGNPNATGAAGERGLFQIHPLHRDSTYDPEGNVRAALRISGGYSWNAWTCKP